jgi:hypothetical protein
MSGYSRDFLIDAFMSRYIKCALLTIEQLVHLESMANDLYDRVGRDSFRTYASLDADAIRIYKNSIS